MKQAACVVTPGLLGLVLQHEKVAGLGREQFRAATSAYLPTPNDFNILDVFHDRRDEDLIVLVGGETGIRDGGLLRFAGELDHHDTIWLSYEEITVSGEPTGRYKASVMLVA